MGAVYEATHQTIQQRVALKVLHAAAAGDKESKDRFCLEARSVCEMPGGFASPRLAWAGV